MKEKMYIYIKQNKIKCKIKNKKWIKLKKKPSSSNAMKFQS
jgi:hypothetical protein